MSALDKTGLWPITFIALAIAALAPALSQPTGKGKSDFLQFCVLCHGYDGTGRGPLAEEMKTPPADLTLIARRHGGKFPADYVKQVISNGGEIKGHGPSDMLAWGAGLTAEQGGGLPDARIEGLTRYIEGLQKH